MLKDKEPRAFIVRDSHSFRGAYGLAMKVAMPPPSVLQLNKKGGSRTALLSPTCCLTFPPMRPWGQEQPSRVFSAFPVSALF